MAQTAQGQAKASRKLVKGTLGVTRKNQSVVGKDEPKGLKVGATKQNTPALRKAKIKANIGV